MMPQAVTRVLAPAKLNLTFEILGLLPDGYHQVLSLMQAVDLEDVLSFEMHAAERWSFTIRGGAPGSETEIRKDEFPLDDSNLIARAADAFYRMAEPEPYDIAVSVEKNIPIAAGMGGGSSDAAATLKFLNAAFGHPLSSPELTELARGIGADVAFCLDGGLQVGRQRGDVLAPIEAPPVMCFAIIKPRHISISTKWIYEEFDRWEAKSNDRKAAPPGRNGRPNTEAAANALKDNDLEKALRNFGNAFEKIVFEHHPEVKRIREDVLALGAWSCHISGSGPTLYAVVADLEMAHMVRRRLQYGQPELDVWFARSLARGAHIETQNR